MSRKLYTVEEVYEEFCYSPQPSPRNVVLRVVLALPNVDSCDDDEGSVGVNWMTL